MCRWAEPLQLLGAMAVRRRLCCCSLLLVLLAGQLLLMARLRGQGVLTERAAAYLGQF